MTDYARDPNDLNSTTDDDLPGVRSHSDSQGGDPDERSYAEREGRFAEFNLVDIQPFQGAINRDIARLAAATKWRDPNVLNPYPLPFEPPTPFVDVAMPQTIIGGIDPADAEAYDWGAIWQIPQPMTIETRGSVSLETLEVALGIPLIPLCRRKIPAQGAE